VHKRGARLLVGRGSVYRGVTRACHSPWHHPTLRVPNTIDSDSLFSKPNLKTNSASQLAFERICKHVVMENQSIGQSNTMNAINASHYITDGR
jgi:hypothetical protein